MMGRIREGVERIRRFNANAAHELRTPLSHICGRIESILARPRRDEEYRESLAQVLNEAQDLAAGVNAMLRLAQSESGIPREQRERVPLGPLLETLVQFFEPLAEERGIAIAAGSFPEVAVEGDGSWLRQLFSNLVDNAVKYCEGGDRIRVEAAARGGRGARQRERRRAGHREGRAAGDLRALRARRPASEPPRLRARAAPRARDRARPRRTHRTRRASRDERPRSRSGCRWPPRREEVLQVGFMPRRLGSPRHEDPLRRGRRRGAGVRAARAARVGLRGGHGGRRHDGPRARRQRRLRRADPRREAPRARRLRGAAPVAQRRQRSARALPDRAG